MTSNSPTCARTEPLGTAATAKHCGRLMVRGIISELPTIIFVRRGQKQIKRGPLRITLNAGGAVMVPSAIAFDIVSTSDGEEFTAAMLIPPQNLIEEIAEEYIDVPSIRSASQIRVIEPEFLAAFDRAVAAASAPEQLPPKVVENRAREVLIWLALKGMRFSNNRKLNVAHKVRTIISQDHARNWTTLEVARTIAMSEATMRRHLVKQGSSFSSILIDVRMTRALALLQITDLSIGQIALEVGYDSPSRFAARFKQRFEISPSAIRTAVPASS